MTPVRESISAEAVAWGGLLISIWPPGSNEIRAASGRFHEAGSSPLDSSVQPSRVARRDRTLLVVRSPPCGGTTSRVRASTGISSSSTPIARGLGGLVGENSRCRTSSSSAASVRLTCSGRTSQREREGSVAGRHPFLHDETCCAQYVVQRFAVVLVAQLSANGLSFPEADLADLRDHHFVGPFGDEMHLHPMKLCRVDRTVLERIDRKSCRSEEHTS